MRLLSHFRRGEYIKFASGSKPQALTNRITEPLQGLSSDFDRVLTSNSIYQANLKQFDAIMIKSRCDRSGSFFNIRTAFYDEFSALLRES